MLQRAEAKEREIGTEIYYGGDMANSEGFGEVVKIHKNARFGDQYEIAMEDGRTITIPPLMIKDEYHGNGGIRFCTAQAYDEWRARQLQRMKERYS